MDITFRCKVISCMAVFFIGPTIEAWYHGFDHEVPLDSLPLLRETYDGFLLKNAPRHIVKRGSDWSKRQRHVSELETRSELNLEPQASDTVEVSTKFPPRVVRKMRLQNVPLTAKQLEGGENVTSTFENKGRVVRIRKFKRKTTPKPATTTVSPSSTTTERPSTRSSVNSLEFSHITVINKEVIDQKPNRKLKNRKQQSLWVPTQGYGARQTDSNEMEVSVPINQIRPTEKAHIRAHSSNKEQNTIARENRYDSVHRVQSSTSERPRNYNGRTSKASAENFKPSSPPDKALIPESSQSRSHQDKTLKDFRSAVPPIPVLLPETSPQAKHVQPDRAQPEMDQKDSTLATTNSSSSAHPKSVEILSDAAPVPYDLPPLYTDINKPPQYVDINHPGYTTPSPLLPYTPGAESPPGQAFQNNFGFQPYQGGPGFRSYIQEDPFFHQPWAGESRNGNPLPPGSFGQPFSPFYGRSNSQFQQNYPNSPSYRSGSLGMPEFYHSPRLLSLRRSVMDVYADDDEQAETTTEFSIPKFEVPSIDFNDKGCRTVYKEVNAVPSEGSKGVAENKAKSFVMTRECYFPEGVPTASPAAEVKEMKIEVSPGAEYV